MDVIGLLCGKCSKDNEKGNTDGKTVGKSMGIGCDVWVKMHVGQVAHKVGYMKSNQMG
jgi:hypothetical protein